MDTTRATAAKVSAAREAAGVTRKDLALYSGIPYTSLYRKLKGQSAWTIDDIASIARVLDRKPSELIVWSVPA